jgi:predicted deacylase
MMQASNTPFEQLHQLDLSRIPKGESRSFWLHIINNGIGAPIKVPLMVARGVKDGPVLGFTAAIHGNELNGIPVLQQLFREVDPKQLRGTLVGGLVMNVPGLLLQQRKFDDGYDLNRIAPGQAEGQVSEVYIYRIVEQVLQHFDFLIDLHTASRGRINSWYIRADMSTAPTARMARLQNPDIILHNPPNDGTFRGAAADLGIHAITLELRDPHVFQSGVIEDALQGLRHVLYDLDMLEGPKIDPQSTILCDSSYWIYTDEGGILEVLPDIRQEVKTGAPIAIIRDVFGQKVKTLEAPEPGIVIGKSVSPVNQTGSRILHLGLSPKRME